MMQKHSARQNLEDWGASGALLRHTDLVCEVATQVASTLKKSGVTLDEDRICAGAILHDAGKIIHPEELIQSGHRHENAGQQLLLQKGVAPELARFCVSHRDWKKADILEELVVALADRLWKGKRDHELEEQVIGAVATQIQRESWSVFLALDASFEMIANDADQRLRRS